MPLEVFKFSSNQDLNNILVTIKHIYINRFSSELLLQYFGYFCFKHSQHLRVLSYHYNIKNETINTEWVKKWILFELEDILEKFLDCNPFILYAKKLRLK